MADFGGVGLPVGGELVEIAAAVAGEGEHVDGGLVHGGVGCGGDVGVVGLVAGDVVGGFVGGGGVEGGVGDALGGG